MKKVTLTPRPKAKPSPDAWVQAKPAGTGGVKRLTIDLPADLHARVKVGVAREGRQIAELVREWLEQRFPK